MKITYVVHSGERTHASAAQDGAVADTWFMDREGTTKACRAYRCLAAMKRELEAATE